MLSACKGADVSDVHPLQSALDRVAAASYSIVDLLDIADQRMGRSASGRRARPDARQPSLYRAAITASVGALEESVEALTASTLTAIGLPETGRTVIETLLAQKMQNPNSDNIKTLMRDYAGFDPSAHWSANLRGCKPAFKRSDLGRVEIHTFYNQDVTYTGVALTPVLNRFVNVRHAFAHQDSSKSLLSKQELQKWFGPLRTRKAQSVSECEFVTALSTTCKVRLTDPASATSDPVSEWTVLDTHAANAIHLLLGVTSSLANALAEYLEAEHARRIGDFAPLVLRVQQGAWSTAGSDRLPVHQNVEIDLMPYRPQSR